MESKLRELAEAVARRAMDKHEWNECAPGVLADELAECLEAAWPTVFAPPEGSVMVRVAVGLKPHYSGHGITVDSCGIDDNDDEDSAVQCITSEHETHFGIIEAWLPPVPQVPTVDGIARSVPDAG